MPVLFSQTGPGNPLVVSGIHNWQYRCRKNEKLLETLAASGRVFCIFGSFDVRADVGHRETLVLLAGTGRAFPEILLALVKRELLTAVDTDVFSRPNLLACRIGLLFGQIYHQTSLLCQRYISVVLVHPCPLSAGNRSFFPRMQNYIGFFPLMQVW